jgi:protein SCO1/2
MVAPAAWAQPTAPGGGGGHTVGSPTAVTQPGSDPSNPLVMAPEARGMDVEEKLGAPLPMELTFTNSDGKQVLLGDYFPAATTPGTRGKPTILALVYYRCPVACIAVKQAILTAMNGLDYTVGDQYNMLLFSIDPSEGPEQARAAKAGELLQYNREITDSVRAGWQFHTGTMENNRALANAIGWPYRLLPNGEYSHPVAIVVITPEGRVSRYFYGFVYEPTQLRLAIMEAGQGHIGKSIGDRIMAFCFTWDPNTGKYSLAAFRVVQVGGVISMLAVGGLVGGLLIVERIRRRRAGPPGGPPAAGGGGGGGVTPATAVA